MPSTIPVAHGETLVNFEIPIKEEAFLGAGSKFEIQLLNVTLDTGEFYVTLNTLRPRQNGRHFADDTCKCIFFNENV